MKKLLQAILLTASAASFTACTNPAPPIPGGGRGRSLDVPPRYGVSEEQNQYLDQNGLTDPNAAAVQPPNPNAPVTGDNVTPPPATNNPGAPAPITVTPPGTTPATPSVPQPPAAPTEIPYATRIDGKPGFVKSPFDPNGQAIDVRDFQSGQKARCPYTGKIFRVP